MASMRIRKLRMGEATEPPFCTVCVACMIHVTLSFPLYPSCSFSRRCCCRSLFDSQLEVEVTSNLCAVICPLSFPYPTPPSPIVGYICKLPAINFCPFAIKHLKRFVQSKRKKLRKKATNRGAKTKRANHFHSIFPHDALLVLYNQRFSHHFHTQLTERENEGARERGE